MYTDIAVPSLHRQDGRQYDGEVILTHVYSQDKDDKRVRVVHIGRRTFVYPHYSFPCAYFHVFSSRLAMWLVFSKRVPRKIATTFLIFTYTVGNSSTIKFSTTVVWVLHACYPIRRIPPISSSISRTFRESLIHMIGTFIPGLTTISATKEARLSLLVFRAALFTGAS